MKEFETIRLLVLAAPFGVFITYLFLLAITFALKAKQVNGRMRVIITSYCALVVLTGVILPWFYYDTEIFERYNIIYFCSVVYMTIVYCNLVYFTADSTRKFKVLHYVPPAVTALGLYEVKLNCPDLWIEYGNEIIFSAALVFVATYTFLQFVVMYKFCVTLSAKSGTPTSINKGRALPFILVTLIIPMYFIVLPLIFGPAPSLFISILIMILISTSLAMNLPVGYSIIQHYGNKQYDNIPLFESSSRDTAFVELPQTPKTDHKHNYIQKNRRIDKTVFEQYFRKKKPYLDSKLTILDLVEPLQSNRSYISRFFKEVYGMNFTGYINRCRLSEVERLSSLPSNKKATLSQLVSKAGFGDYSSYYRARKQLDETMK